MRAALGSARRARGGGELWDHRAGLSHISRASRLPRAEKAEVGKIRASISVRLLSSGESEERVFGRGPAAQ